MQWRQRRLERSIRRLSDRIERLRDEIAVLDAQAGQLTADADDAAVTAAVRPAGPTDRDAARATAARDNHRRLLADQRAELDALVRRRDDLLDRL